MMLKGQSMDSNSYSILIKFNQQINQFLLHPFIIPHLYHEKDQLELK